VTLLLPRAFKHEALLIGGLYTVKLILHANITGTQRGLYLSRLKLACQDDPPGLLYLHKEIMEDEQGSLLK